MDDKQLELWFKFWTVENKAYFIFQLCMLSNLVMFWPVQFEMFGVVGDALVSTGLLLPNRNTWAYETNFCQKLAYWLNFHFELGMLPLDY